MKNKIILAVLALVLGASPALAQTDATSSAGYRLIKPFQDIREEYQQKREEVKNKLQADKQEIKGEIKDVRAESRDAIKAATSSEERDQIRAERKDQVDALRLDRIRSFVTQMQSRLEAALARSQKFVDRMTAFLNERETAGVDVSAARAKVSVASSAIASSTAKVSGIPTAVESALSASSTPKDIFANIKKIIGDGVTAIKAAQQKVVDAVKALKSVPTGETATSTESN